ncbi:MAG: RNA ligase, partial [Thermoprotei archaeon]
DEDLVLCGEVVGEENPYVQHYYPEAPYFDYFVFDIMRGKSFVKIKERDNIINNTKVKLVRRLGVIGKDDLNTLQHIVRRLERDCREGIVLKDPEHRVKPLKYTTTCTHLNDLELGMKYPFDEGRSFLFSRILREIWKIYEEGIDEKELAERAKALGLAILKPALESINRLREDKAIYEEYTIRVPDIRVLDDFIEYMDKLGVNIALAQVTPLPDGQVKARIIKMKNTDIEFRRILRTGYSPID